MVLIFVPTHGFTYPLGVLEQSLGRYDMTLALFCSMESRKQIFRWRKQSTEGSRETVKNEVWDRRPQALEQDLQVSGG